MAWQARKGGLKTSTVERTKRKTFSWSSSPMSFPGNGLLLEGFRKAHGLAEYPTRFNATISVTARNMRLIAVVQDLPKTFKVLTEFNSYALVYAADAP
jgi:hypothetical protein